MPSGFEGFSRKKLWRSQELTELKQADKWETEGQKSKSRKTQKCVSSKEK